MGRRSKGGLVIPPEIYRLFVLDETALGKNIKYRRILGERCDIINLYGKRYLASQVVEQKISYEGGVEQILEERALEVLVSRFLGGDELNFIVRSEKVIDLEEQRKVGLVLRLEGFRGKIKFE